MRRLCRMPTTTRRGLCFHLWYFEYSSEKRRRLSKAVHEQPE